MPKNAIADWDVAPANNSDIAGINIAEGCPAGGINDAIRTLMAQLASWVLSAPGPLLKSGGTATGDLHLTYTSTIKDGAGADRSIGYRNVPVIAKTGAYQLALSDVGLLVSITAGGITVPANATTPFSIGDIVTIYNNAASSQTITAAAGVTLRLVGSASTGNRAITQRGICTLLKVAADEWVATGGGLS